MPAPSTATEFLALIRKSGLYDGPALDKYFQKIPNYESMPALDLARKMLAEGLLSQFQANHLLKGRYKNFFIGKYKVVAPLGSGGMSQVFLCEHVVMRHRVALKLLQLKETQDPSTLSRFLREARAAAAVNHPNVVRAHDFDQAEGKFYYLVMDYIDGVNLQDLVMKHGPLAEEQAANYISQTAAGLQHINECNLIHRDLKPSNLLLDRAGVVRILDLGLVRSAEDDRDNVTKQFNQNSILGTADYLSPEQALHSETIDIRSDIYSLGITLYFLVSGRAPYEELSIAQKLMAHQFRELPPLPNISEELFSVLTRMTAKNPDQRYQSPTDVVEALTPWLDQFLPPPPDSYFPPPGMAAGPSTGGSRSPLTGSNSAANPPSRIWANTGPASGGQRSGGLGAANSAGRLNSGSRTTLSRRDSPASGSMSKPNLLPPRKPAFPLWAKIAIGAGLVGVLATLGLFLSGVFASSPEPKPGLPTNTTQPSPDTAKATAPPNVAPQWTASPAGSLVVGPDGFATLADALNAAKAGSMIVLTNPTHSESLSLNSPPEGITIQPWPTSRRVVWKPAVSDQPCVSIQNAVGTTFTGIDFVGVNSRVGVEVVGNCPGLHLSQSSFAGFREAVRFGGAVATAEKPILLERCRFLGSASESAIVLRGMKNVEIQIQQNRFEGAFRPAILCDSALVHVALSYNRFTDSGLAVSYTRAAASSPLLIQNNLFHRCEVGLWFDALPESPSLVTVQNNLFFKTASTAKYSAADGLTLGRENAVWVWHDEGLAAAKETNTPAGKRYFRTEFMLPKVPENPVMLELGVVSSWKLWVNGQELGQSAPDHFTKRVFAVPIVKYLVPGKNVIAIEATHTLDPIDPAFAVAGGLTVRVSIAGNPTPIVQTPTDWKSSAQQVADWQTTNFADTAWQAVKPWDKPGYLFPWAGSAWDLVVLEQLKLKSVIVLNARGNVRDYVSTENFPSLQSVRGYVPKLAGDDPANDATYLRTPSTPRKLSTAGVGNTPVGVPLGK